MKLLLVLALGICGGSIAYELVHSIFPSPFVAVLAGSVGGALAVILGSRLVTQLKR